MLQNTNCMSKYSSLSFCVIEDAKDLADTYVSIIAENVTPIEWDNDELEQANRESCRYYTYNLTFVVAFDS